MRRSTILLALVSASVLALAACDPPAPMPGNQVGDENVVVDEDLCGPEYNRVCK